MEIQKSNQTPTNISSSNNNSIQENQNNEKTAPQDFKDMVLSMTPSGANSQELNEEELFAGLIAFQLKSSGKTEALELYQKNVTNATGSKEELAKDTLKSIREAGLLTAQEADSIYSKAFSGAQLDNDSAYLFDGIGGNDDPSKATMETMSALNQAYSKISDEEGEVTVSGVARSVDEATPLLRDILYAKGYTTYSNHDDSSPVDKFLFKPVSDTTSNLVVLTPSSKTGSVSSVLLKDAAGALLEQGSFSGVGNGNREHFRFSKPGASYPANLQIETLFKDGTSENISISDPSQRLEE
jgi:hypothetical protein